jgi:hypothetical protein
MPEYEDDDPQGYYIATPDKVRRKIRWIKPYVDRITIWFSHYPRYDIPFLKTLCIGGAFPNTEKTIKIADVVCRYKLDLYQPTRAAFNYLINNARPSIRHFVNSVEMSLDFTTETEHDLRYVRSFFERHWTRRWHKSGWYKKLIRRHRVRMGQKRYINNFVQTFNHGMIYYHDRKSGVHYKLYSDYLSKVNRKPCCHLEVKLQKYSNLWKAHLDSLDAYLESGVFRRFWENHLQLREARGESEVKRIINDTVRRNMEGQSEKKIRQTILRIFKTAYHGEDNYIAQEIVDKGKFVDGLHQLLVEIPNQPFLPSRAAKIPVNLYKRTRLRTSL